MMHCRSQRERPRRLSAYGRKHMGKTGLSRIVSARQYPRISVRARIQRSTLSRADWPVSVDVEAGRRCCTDRRGLLARCAVDSLAYTPGCISRSCLDRVIAATQGAGSKEQRRCGDVPPGIARTPTGQPHEIREHRTDCTHCDGSQ
ncbi:conserved hypothetical protein [Xanthomonas citri pv. aurantifolii str. ICPB 11122]|nr:conserved hypothetical protein [Xanthomonas citri pv. aurantifolii str. ICPB 11122]EFF47277.1 conserved hypothetical protein [Xanthomonas citri pv. aurantifolii str. ICPB 10535]